MIDERIQEYIKRHVQAGLGEDVVPGEDILVVFEPNPPGGPEKIILGKTVVKGVEERPETKRQKTNQPGTDVEIALESLTTAKATEKPGPFSLVQWGNEYAGLCLFLTR